MKLRLQADADLNQRIVAGVRRLEPVIDIQSVREAMFEGKSDLEVLVYCAHERRILLTHDQKTMPHHFATFMTERTSTGVIIVPQEMAIGKVVTEFADCRFSICATTNLRMSRHTLPTAL